MHIPVYVISGFLGAGKTSLLNNILETSPADARIMVLLNEFGKISIDKEVIKADPVNIVDLSGGCICCGMFTELMASLRFALDDLKADIILIESTGLAIPQEIARQALTPAFHGRIEFGGIITVVDAAIGLSEEYPIIHEQLKEANVVVLNKIDLVDRETLMKVRERIESIIPAESIVFETTFGNITYGELFLQHYDESHILEYSKTPFKKIDTTAGFETILLVKNSPVERERLIELYNAHYNKIVRSKGFVLTEDGVLEFQLFKDGVELKKTGKTIERTEIILIVKEENKKFIEEEFKKALGVRSV